MSWTRLDDLWTERADLAELSHATRWHFLSMIQRCSRSDLRDGVLRMVDARRCSDHPDPDSALLELARVGLVDKASDTTVRVVGIDDYLPSESTRQRTENNRAYKQRSRERAQRHGRGDHSLCSLDKCRAAGQSVPVSADVSTHVTADVGTGRDWTTSVPSRDGTDVGRANGIQGAALATPQGAALLPPTSEVGDGHVRGQDREQSDVPPTPPGRFWGTVPDPDSKEQGSWPT